jgi:hypothetical protein
LVAPGAKFVALGDGDATPGVKGQDFVQAILVLGPAHQGGADGVSIGAYLFY